MRLCLRRYRAQNSTRQRTLIFIVGEYHFSTYDSPDDSPRTFDETWCTSGKVGNPFERLSTNRCRIEYDQVRVHSGLYVPSWQARESLPALKSAASLLSPGS